MAPKLLAVDYMASSPTVLASRNSADSISKPVPIKFPMGPLFVAVLSGVFIAALGMGGGFCYLRSKGRLQMSAPSAAKAQSPTTASTHIMVLNPLLVNLADAGGNAYLRVSIALKVANADSKSDKRDAVGDAVESNSVAEVRDIALMVLGQETSEDILKSDGKERLKTELKAELAKRTPELKVEDIFFVDLLVQR